MSKRKVSAERNIATAKDTTRRPSVASIHTRATTVPLQRRRSQSGKSPSPETNLNQGTMTKLSKTILATGDSNAAPPKTSFNAQDRSKELRSNSSPRLKSFPAERIRKFDNPALFDTKPIRSVIGQANQEPSSRFTMPTASVHNHEYGDHVRGMMNPGQQNQSQVPENVCQQQICTNYSMHQGIPQAEGPLTYRVPGPDRHRPNVPHGHQSQINAVAAPASLAYVHNGQAPVAQLSTPATHVRAQKSQRSQEEATNYGGQKQPEWVTDEHTQVTDLEKQPVGGRNSVMHRRAVMQERQQDTQQMQAHSNPSMYANVASQHTNRPMSVPPSQNNMQPLPYLTHENPHQVYQQLQNNIARQQQMQQRAFNQQMQIMSAQQQAQHQAQGNQAAYYNYFTQQLPGRGSLPHGMTSPQDANVNQTRIGQNAATSMQQVQQQNTTYSNNKQNGVVPSNQVLISNPNVQSQLRPYTINIVDNAKPQDAAYNQHAHNHEQVSQMYRQTIPGQQMPNNFQQQHIMPQNHFQQQNATPQNHTQQQNVIPQNYIQQQNAIAQNHIQQQNAIAQNHMQQVAAAENANMQANNQMHANRRRNHLKFSPKMIRDQELLVATMKQQGISDELMRRQFDALLREQRKQLEYLQQFEQENDLPVTKKQEIRRKIQMDEKPEWMAHITPPRIPYSDFEKMNAKVKEQNSTTPQQQMTEYQMVEYNGMQQNANNQQVTPPSAHNHNQSAQQNTYQNWQQQNPNWQQQNPNWQQQNPNIQQQNPNRQQQNPNMQQHNPNMQQQNPNWQQTTGLPPGSQYTHASSQPPQHQHQHQHAANNSMQSQNPAYWQQQQNMQQPYQQAAYYQQPQQVSWQYDQPQREQGSHFFKKAVSLNDLNVKNSEPSSLLKLRLYKDVIRPQKRNNGLQDPETIQKALEILNNPESSKGLEYLANLNRKKQLAKLNGMQHPNDVISELIPRPPLDNSEMIPQRTISANGLENTRNPNNPLPQPLVYLKRSEAGGTMNEFPRQKQNNPRNRYSLMAEREDGTIAPNVSYQESNPITQAQQFHLLQQNNHQRVIPYNNKNPLSALNKSMSYKFDGIPPEHYHQVQQYYQNKQNMVNSGQGDVPTLNKPDASNVPYRDRPGGDTADLSHFKDNGQTQNKMAPSPQFGQYQRLNGSYDSPEIREAKTIGGVMYLARKPDYIPNQPMTLENSSIANKYVQPTVIYN
ncbi:hypothetical protein KPH14_005454 [Odynerus spinipes]|uniref:Uncharacterized protein n=1 Tax=Odynerus spinipes TaxID=1348599 RepID=A0AAD9RCB0_9HYME|nr:hypothetical protein KPH14_005454 [Odynerus spinipes]